MLARLFGPFFVFAGVMHFVVPRTYEAIVPDYLPAHSASWCMRAAWPRSRAAWA